MDGRRFLTPKEVAARYNGQITHLTLANWRSSGVIVNTVGAAQDGEINEPVQ